MNDWGHNGDKPRQPLDKIAISNPRHQGCAPARHQPDWSSHCYQLQQNAKLDKLKLAQQTAKQPGHDAVSASG